MNEALAFPSCILIAGFRTWINCIKTWDKFDREYNSVKEAMEQDIKGSKACLVKGL